MEKAIKWQATHLTKAPSLTSGRIRGLPSMSTLDKTRSPFINPSTEWALHIISSRIISRFSNSNSLHITRNRLCNPCSQFRTTRIRTLGKTPSSPQWEGREISHSSTIHPIKRVSRILNSRSIKTPLFISRRSTLKASLTRVWEASHSPVNNQGKMCPSSTITQSIRHPR